MITFLRAVEGLLCIRGSTSDPELNATAKVSGKAITRPGGFELGSEFGWSFQVEETEYFIPSAFAAKPKTSEEMDSPATARPPKRHNFVWGRADWLDCSLDLSICSQIISVAEPPKRRKRVWRRAPSPPPYLPPLWQWPALYLLEALLICAREDPDVSVTLALDMHETDSVISREVQLLRDGFLRHTSFHGIRLCKMSIESSDFRLHLQTMAQEMEEEVRRVERILKKARRLQTEILECRCSDMLLDKLNARWKQDEARKATFVLQKRPVKKLIKCH